MTRKAPAPVRTDLQEASRTSHMQLTKVIAMNSSQVGRAAAMIGAGAVVLMPALVLLLFAVSAGLIRGGFSEPVAYLLTGAGAALVSAALIAAGLSRLSGDALKPSVALDQVQRDKIAAKEMVR
jgi:hypothetical protein